MRRDNILGSNIYATSVCTCIVRKNIQHELKLYKPDLTLLACPLVVRNYNTGSSKTGIVFALKLLTLQYLTVHFVIRSLPS